MNRDELRKLAEAVLAAGESGRYRNGQGLTVDFRAAQRAAEAGSRCYSPAELAQLSWPEPAAGPSVSVGEASSSFSTPSVSVGEASGSFSAPSVSVGEASGSFSAPSVSVGEASGSFSAPSVSVGDESSSAAARRLVVEEAKENVVLLNFASARNPGGGFLSGARAQEEDLCRSSGLYLCQRQTPSYYEANRREKSLLYTDHMIYSPAVPFFHVGGWLEDYFCVDVITAPAPNAGAHRQKHPEDGPAVRRTLRRRAQLVLDLAAARGCRHLILGAWGCGVFRNDPEEVAAAWAAGLAAKAYPFVAVHFAIYDRSADQNVLRAFHKRFNP